MIEWWQLLTIGGFVVIFVGLVLVGVQLRRLNGISKPSKKGPGQSFNEQALEESGGLFNKEFHEELRNRGRLHFEKIVSENAMFLKQDLDMTIAQMNEYLKKTIGSKLDEEFAAYEKAMKEAQELAINSLQKSATAVEEQRLLMVETLKKDVADKEALLIKTYEENMAKIVEHYILETLGDQFDLKTQLPFIISQMEANKQKIVDDMRL
jgi:uncharacterized protein YbjQ (UPF0145 family)